MSSLPVISLCPAQHLPLELLLLADPEPKQIQRYLPACQGISLQLEQQLLGAALVQPMGDSKYEIMAIAVQPEAQQQGYGSLLLRWLLDYYRQQGAQQLAVATGCFGYQLGFYQRQGFRVEQIRKNFFLEHYAEPVFEQGIQHFDQLYLVCQLQWNTIAKSGKKSG